VSSLPTTSHGESAAVPKRTRCNTAEVRSRGFDWADGDTEGRGDLRFGEFGPVPQHHDLALPVGQGSNCRQDRSMFLGEQCRCVRAVNRDTGRIRLRVLADRPATSQDRTRSVVHAGAQVGHCRVLTVQRISARKTRDYRNGCSTGCRGARVASLVVKPHADFITLGCERPSC
jgi:hypothetical protein